MTDPRAEIEALRERVVAAMPWYDESNPDYAELDAILAAILNHDCARDMPNEVECGICGWQYEGDKQ